MLGSFSSEDPFDASACVDMIWAVSSYSSLASDPLFLARGMHEVRGIVRVNFRAADGVCEAANATDDGAVEPQRKKKKTTSSGPDTAVVAGVVAAAVVLLALGVAGAYLFRRRGVDAAPDDAKLGEYAEESKEARA